MERFQLLQSEQTWGPEKAQLSPPLCFPGGTGAEKPSRDFLCITRAEPKLCTAQGSPNTKQN